MKETVSDIENNMVGSIIVWVIRDRQMEVTFDFRWKDNKVSGILCEGSILKMQASIGNFF